MKPLGSITLLGLLIVLLLIPSIASSQESVIR